MTTATDDTWTRAGKGKMLYKRWAVGGGISDPAEPTMRDWGALSAHEQSRWIWLAKMMGEPKHDHHMPTPADVLKYPEATMVSRTPEMWDFDGPDTAYPASNRDAFYLLWAEQRQSQVRQHWWQIFRPTEVDTSRELFDKQLKSYLRAARDRDNNPIADL